MWVRANGGTYAGDLINVRSFWRLRVGGSGANWHVEGFLPGSSTALWLSTAAYTSEEAATEALHALAAGLPLPDPS